MIHVKLPSADANIALHKDWEPVDTARLALSKMEPNYFPYFLQRSLKCNTCGRDMQESQEKDNKPYCQNDTGAKNGDIDQLICQAHKIHLQNL